MDENILKFRVGIFVVIAMCILGILILLNSEGWVRQYTVYLKTPSAQGVTVGTPIRKNGILIGRVKEVEPVLHQENEDEEVEEVVLVTMAINDGVQLYDLETCSIGSDSLLGDAAIEIVPTTIQKRGQLVVAGSEVPMMKNVDIAPNPIKIVGDMAPQLKKTLAAIEQASQGVEKTSGELQQLTGSIRSAFQDEDSEFKAMINDFRKMTVNAQDALKDVDRFFEVATNIIDDPELIWQLKQAGFEILPIMQEIKLTIQDTRQTINSYESIPERVNENLDNLKTFTESLQEQGPETLDNIKNSARNIDELVTQVKSFTNSLGTLENSQGTIAKLIKDPELYNSLLMTVKKIQRQVIKIEPTMNDIRMFTDAIARDPGILGVRGALNRKNDKSGYKGSAGREGGIFK